MAKISIFTPSYNKRDIAIEAIQSVLSQSFNDFEYWVIENSTDSQTREKVKRIAQTDKRIRYVELDFSGNMREKYYIPALILNEYYPKATGEYIFYLSDDDLFYPHCFATCMDFMESRKDAFVGYFSLKVTEEYKPGKFKYLYQILATQEKGLGAANPRVDCVIDGGQIVHRAECLQHIEYPYFLNELSQNDTHHMDGLFMEKLAAKYTFYPIPSDHLVEHRRTNLSTFVKPGMD
jgi:spore maturation protein CgeD